MKVRFPVYDFDFDIDENKRRAFIECFTTWEWRRGIAASNDTAEEIQQKTRQYHPAYALACYFNACYELEQQTAPRPQPQKRVFKFGEWRAQ